MGPMPVYQYVEASPCRHFGKASRLKHGYRNTVLPLPAPQRCGNMRVLSSNASRRVEAGVAANFSGRMPPMSKPRISYIDPSTIKDPAMIVEFERCAREGTPRPESQAIRAHVPATFWSFANTWRDVFKNGIADHRIKELCRIYVSRSVLCEFCGNQRSIKAAKAGLKEDD